MTIDQEMSMLEAEVANLKHVLALYIVENDALRMELARRGAEFKPEPRTAFSPRKVKHAGEIAAQPS